MMSNFKIVHEIDGRLRVRFGQYAGQRVAVF